MKVLNRNSSEFMVCLAICLAWGMKIILKSTLHLMNSRKRKNGELKLHSKAN